VTDRSSPVESDSKALTFNVAWPKMVASAPSLPDGTVDVPYSSVTFSATGGDGTYSWSASAALPAGLSLSTSGVLSGTPTAAGTFTVYALVADHSGDQATVVRTLVISPLPADLSGLPPPAAAPLRT
jgi:hypothetical protein